MSFKRSQSPAIQRNSLSQQNFRNIRVKPQTINHVTAKQTNLNEKNHLTKLSLIKHQEKSKEEVPLKFSYQQSWAITTWGMQTMGIVKV